MESKIQIYEKEYLNFKPTNHFQSRIQEMEGKSRYGAIVASKWREMVNQLQIEDKYPVIHPIGQETFSLYAEFPTGVFEYALDIDGATSRIKEKGIKPVVVCPTDIIDSVDRGNINKNPSLFKPNHKNPVMVIQSKYLTDDRPYCINGNHRIYEAFRNDDKQIEVYIFKDLEFVPFFYDDLSKAMYYLEIDYQNVTSEKRHYIDSERTAFVNEIEKN